MAEQHSPSDRATGDVRGDGADPGEHHLDAPDAALAAAIREDDEAPYDLDDLAAEVDAPRALLESLSRAGLLLPHHLDEGGVARYSAADARAVRAGVVLLDAGLPLGELLDLARGTDEAIRQIAGQAVEAFLRFVRDPVRGAEVSDEEAAQRMVTAYERMLPATQQLVAHQLRRRLLAEAARRASDAPVDSPDDDGRSAPP